MKKSIFAFVTIVSLLLCSCSVNYVIIDPADDIADTETDLEPGKVEETKTTDAAENCETGEQLPFDEPMTLVFSSGAGAWRTELVLEPDGSFEGHFSDGEMGDRDEEKYPYGTRYVCDFVGSFYNITKISDTSYSLQIKNLECEKAEGEEWIDDGIRFVASVPYGMEGEDFVFYTPDAPYAELPEYVQLWDYRYFVAIPEKLGLYSLYSTTGENAFFSHEAS